MNRYFVRTAAAVFCASWAAGCGSDGATTAAHGPAPAPANVQAATDEQPTTLEAEIAKAHVLRVQGNYDAAAKSFAQLMLIAPDDVRVVGEYGKVLAQQGRSADAIPFLKRALELQQGDWTLYSALGVADDQIDDHPNAKIAYQHALALKPGEPAVLNNYAVSRMLAGDLDGAQRLLAEASSSGGADPKIAQNLSVLADMRRPGQAVATATDAQPQIRTAPAEIASTNPHQTSGAPRALATVEMQKIPVDPKAGPVGKKTAMARTQTTVHKTKLASAHADGRHDVASATSAPVLRTAADNQ